MAESPVKLSLTGDLTPLIQALGNDLNTVPGGIKKLFYMFGGKKYAQSLYNQLMLAAQAQVDYKLIMSGRARFIDGKIQFMNEPEYTSLFNLKQLDESDNLASCAIEAIKDTLEDIPINDEGVSEDFFAHWRREAVYASSIEAQKLWGKLLSEENRHPGTFSLKTIDILKNVDKKCASLFNKACNYIVDSSMLLIGLGNGNGQLFNRHSLDKKDLDILGNVGLMSLQTLVDAALPEDDTILFPYMEYGVIIKSKLHLEPHWRHLTPSGTELYKIIFKCTQEKVEKFCQFILSQNIPSIEQVGYIVRNNPEFVGSKWIKMKIVKL